MRIFQILWPKTLLLDLLNVRFTTFTTKKLSPFDTIMGHTMHLAPAPFDMQLIKGDILQYHKGLIASIKNNHLWGTSLVVQRLRLRAPNAGGRVRALVSEVDLTCHS